MAGFKVLFSFDPFDMANVDRPAKRGVQKDALEAIADYVKTEMLQYYGDAESPVSGGKWKAKLSPKYEEFKDQISGSTVANMELYGDMLDALEAYVDGNKIVVGWSGGDQAAKAYGHQTGYDGHPTIKNGPVRQLVPEKGQKFKRDIVTGMKEIAQEFLDEES